MVFISMNSDDLLNRTAQYQFQYVPARYHARHIRGGDGGHERRSLDLLDLPISLRYNDDGTITPHRMARRIYAAGPGDDDMDRRTAQMPVEFTNTLQPFRITAECSDDDSETESPRTARRPPNRIGSLPFESDSSEGGSAFELDHYDFDGTQVRNWRRSRNNPELEAAAEASQHAAQEAVRAVGGELMTPHAKFFIEKEKSKCTLRFDPPVSGRFILLKMWSPHLDPQSNIDIQAVIARGFAGPRYFPSVELR